MRIIRTLIILSGWLILIFVGMITMSPVMALFVDATGYVPLENVVPSIIAVVGIGVPILYGASFAIAPLIFATMELFDNDDER